MRKLIMSFALMCCAATARAEPVTVAALGDSLTQGYGLVQKEGFVPQLEKWLQSQGADVVLINAGVSGDTTAGGASRVGWTLTPDVDAMIVALGGNDLLRGIDPAVSRQNLETILSEAAKAEVEVLLIGMEAPGNYGPDYKAAFEANYAELAQTFGTLFLPRFFDGISGEAGDPAAMRPFLQPDGIHPNAQGVARIVETIGPTVLDLLARVKDSSK
ncbi:arylesterase [Arenibacterium sp. CAU 1754]